MDENKSIEPDIATKEKKKKSLDSESTVSNVIDDDEEGKCGYGSCEPGFLQCCNSAKGFLVVYCFLVIVQGRHSRIKRFSDFPYPLENYSKKYCFEPTNTKFFKLEF